MTTREKLEVDYAREAKARNAFAVSVLRMLRAALKNAEIDKMKPLTEEDAVGVIGREAKKLKDSVADFAAGGRQDLVKQTEAELAFMQQYLPAAIGDDELRKLINDKIAAFGQPTMKDFGRIMGEVTKETKGRADGAKVSAMVKEALAGGST